MKRYFYLGDGPKNDWLVQKVCERIDRCRAAREQLAKDYGACKLWEQGGRIAGLAYRKRMNVSWLVLACSTGQYLVYRGNTDTQKGREVMQGLRDDKKLLFDPEAYILEVLRAQRLLRVNGCTVCSWAFCARGKIGLSIPGSKKRMPETEPFPALPDWLREVSGSEWREARYGREYA